ncbi:hypothetical protein [Kribbella sandramycini]|uniref:DoxX-like protein n=1 Tax=Kribbella sandramycini TaxID=60450 RepID=A0A841S3N6_9ACTN|nr:hypothetical protein [Kribbella sandramycini]
MKMYIRSVLVVFAAFELVLGVWMSFLPASFYAMPTLDWTPPYSEHLLRDLGGMKLGMALILAVAAITFDHLLTKVALLAYLAFALTHLIFHAGHLHWQSPGWSITLLTIMTVSVLAPLTALLATLTPTPKKPRSAN